MLPHARVVECCLAVVVHQIEIAALDLMEKELDRLQVTVNCRDVDRATTSVVRHVEVGSLILKLLHQLMAAGGSDRVDDERHDRVRDFLLLRLVLDIEDFGHRLHDLVVLQRKFTLALFLRLQIRQFATQVLHHELLCLLI